MKNKRLIILTVAVCLLAGAVVWQQVAIKEIQSRLTAAELTGIESSAMGTNSILSDLAEIESQLDSNEKMRELAQSDMAMTWTDSMYFMATQNWDLVSEYLDQYTALNNTMTSLLSEHDELMAQKIALLRGQ